MCLPTMVQTVQMVGMATRMMVESSAPVLVVAPMVAPTMVLAILVVPMAKPTVVECVAPTMQIVTPTTV